MPFVATGRGGESYNVVSAVSKAVKQARSGRPAEVSESGFHLFVVDCWRLVSLL